MKKVVCAICKSNNNTKLLYKETVNLAAINQVSFSARRTPDKHHYRITECVKCGLIFSNPILDSQKIERFYRESDFNYKKESDYLKKTYYDYFNKFIKPKNKKVKILEIGCGNGFFLEELFDKGFKNIHGIEPGVRSVNKARPNIKDKIVVDVLKRNIFKDNYFDIICCFHTMDHIVDMYNFMREVNSLLKTNGKALFIVHDTKSLSVKLLGEKSPIFDIEHIYLFNKKSLNKLFNKYEFMQIKTFRVINKYPISYWAKLFPMPDKIKKKLIWILAVTKFGFLPFSLPAGNIGVVARKRKTLFQKE